MAGPSKGKDLAAQIARQPPHIKAVILVGVLAVLGFVYWQFFYSTLADEKKQAAVTRKKLASEEEKLKEKEKEYKELLTKKKELDAQLAKNQLTLPASSELPAFFMHLQKQAAASGVTITRWSRTKEKEVESYVKVPVAMTVTGTFYQINNYLRLLAKTDRIITIESLTLGSADTSSDEVVLTAKFIAATFRQKDRPPDTSFEDVPDEPPAAPAKGAGAAKGSKPAGDVGAGTDRLTNPGGVPAGGPQ